MCGSGLHAAKCDDPSHDLLVFFPPTLYLDMIGAVGRGLIFQNQPLSQEI